MPDELYRPPTCPIYVDRLIADTVDLSNEEFGVYVRLMLSRQWPKGSIPADVAAQAKIVGNVPLAKMKKISAAIGERLKPHPVIPNAVHSPFMEIVREEMRVRNKRASDNGKKGADKRWHDETPPSADGKAIATPEQDVGKQPIAGLGQSDELRTPISVTTLDKSSSVLSGAADAPPTWFEKIRDGLTAFADVGIRTLSLEQRITLGRYCAFNFAGYTSNEMNNLRKARDFAAQIEAISVKPRFAQKSVREFIGACRRTLAATNSQAMHSLWNVTAAFGEGD